MSSNDTMTDRELELQHDKVSAEIAKLMAETAKLNKEIKWYEIIVVSGVTLAIVAIAKLFL